ncbi:MAG: His-Xaa-Ser system protein HxsD [Nanoarchaeota archaeon]|nr:His-Xaa-Ser system protein HxsD [Nanoarchaeota archaeon]
MGKTNKNIKVNYENDSLTIEINPLIYDLDVIYSACYVFLDRAYMLIDGDPKKKVYVEMTPKENQNMETIGGEFNNELLNYAHYKKMGQKNAELRKIILQRALITNDPTLVKTHIEKS